MKRLILLPILVFTFFVNAQFTGKPIYNILVERADTIIGNIEVEMFPTISPMHVANWDSIVLAGGYDSTAFHRIISGFMIQGGDPNSVSGPTSTWGQGNSAQANVNQEFNEVPHDRGILSAARSSNVNSASSQFFICHGDATFLDGDYTVYGEAISGMDIVDLIVTAPKDANDLPNEKIKMSITRTGSNNDIPDSPVLVAPVDEFIPLTNSDKFQWTAVNNTKLYRLEIATDSLFSNIVYTKETKNTYGYVNKLTNGYTKHYWRVRANNGGKFSINNEVRTFTTSLGAPKLISPAHEDFYTSDKPFFDWEDGNNVSKYKIEVSISSIFSNPSITTKIEQEVTNSHYQTQISLDKYKNYYWRVTAFDNDGNESEKSVTYQFKADHVKGIVELDDKNKLTISPNPFENELLVTTKLLNRFEMYNVLGKKVLDEELNIGQTIINTSSLKPGVYIYKTLGSNGKIIKK